MALPKPVCCLFSVAFARSAGVTSIQASIAALKITPKIFVGIRNDITSIQAIHQLLALGAELYTVDTGARRPIFHPKLYVICSKTTAKAIIGSANLTYYGLQNNIEVSALLELDLSNEDDVEFVSSVFNSFEELVKLHPEHVQRVKTVQEANKLFAQGRLCDESIVIAPPVTQTAPKTGGIELSRMKLFAVKSQKKAKKSTANSAPTGKSGKKAISKTQFVLVWRSKPLTARDLNVPDGKNTNPTGSIGLKQDALDGFDYQTHFRNNIFSGLKWAPTAKEPLKEESKASFQLVIENMDYGVFELKLAHDNRTNTKSYKQLQFMTQLHWGSALLFIKRRDLLGRTLMLYKKDGKPPTYLIEID